MLALLLTVLPQLGDLDAVPHSVLGSSELRAGHRGRKVSFSRSGHMALLADQVHVFELKTRKLVHRIGRDRVIGDDWTMGLLDDSGKFLAMTHTEIKEKKAHHTTEIWDQNAVAVHRYNGHFVGWGPDGLVLTSQQARPKELKSFSLDFSPNARVLRCFSADKEVAKAGIIGRGFTLSNDRSQLFCVVSGPKLQIRDARTLRSMAGFSIAGEADELGLFIGEVSGSSDLMVSLGGDTRRYRRNGEEVWHLEETSHIVTHPSKPIGVAFSRPRDRLVVLDLDRGKVVRVLKYPNSTYYRMRPDGVLAIDRFHWHGQRFINIETGQELADDFPIAPSTRLQFRPTSHDLLAVSSETVVWDVDSKKVKLRVPGRSMSVGYTNDGSRIYCFREKTLRWFDAKGGQQVLKVDLLQHEKRRAEPLHNRGLGDVQPGTGRLAFINRRGSARVLSKDGSATLFEQLSKARDDSYVAGLTYFSGFTDILFRPDMDEVATLNRFGDTVAFNQISTGKRTEFKVRCSTSTEPNRSMLFRSRDELLLRLTSTEPPYKVRLGMFRTPFEKPDFVIEEELAQFHDFVFSPDKKYLVSGGQQNRDNEARWFTKYSFDYGLLRIYDAATGEPVAAWKSKVAITSIAVSDDSQLVAIGMADTTVRLMNFADLLPK